ncbi:hypothetical protein FA15DRAFT_586614 [Coprinopsis marcescibilis]|uniref:Postreplication repair E3 ubiquitin-protein ligase RAD18 n=1 Tax=Coprinopsis marcescibilis TaxID=230819 RepID=A0A5C3L3L6_COPMA|nr:hypothetical protein FA15DRAFT_586614 [Coprinopsis marcescibilis]
MVDAISTRLLDSVPDPTDFPPQENAPGLRKLDSTFRCTICGEVFDAPVTTRCGHCFCSGCLRPALALKQECPTCRKSTNEMHIRPNYVMEEAIMCWGESRTYILELIKREKEAAEAVSKAKASQRSHKRKRSGSTSSVEMLDCAPGPSSPRTPRRRQHSPRKHKAVDLTTVPSSDVDEDELSSINLNPKPNQIVPCPLCSKTVAYKDLNTHIDRGCKDFSKEKASETWSKILSKPPNKQKGKQRCYRKHSDSDDEQPLPLASYATLKDRQLREMLGDHGLPTQGDRSLLEQRHQRWVVFYNTNLDRSLPNRKSKSALRQELKKWEETHFKVKKPVVQDAKEHVKTHKSEFSKLVSIARGSQPQITSTIPSSVSPQPMSPG